MYGLLVGGYLPGTNIQISFEAWLILAAVITVTIVTFRLLRKAHRHLVRLPLHASQLHSRLQSAR